MTYSDIFEPLARGIVQSPHLLQIEQKRLTRNKFLISVSCDPADFGILVGKNARHVRAFQQILRRMALKRSEEVKLVINTPDEQKQAITKPEKFTNSWDRDHELARMFEDVLRETTEDGYKVKSWSENSMTCLIAETKKCIEDELFQAIVSVFHAWGVNNGRRIQIENDCQP